MLGLVEVVLIAWILRKLKTLRTHADEISDLRLGAWWNISLTLITPVVLGYMLYQLFRKNLLRLFETDTGNYENYPDLFILYSGWFVALGALVLALVLTTFKWKKDARSQEH